MPESAILRHSRPQAAAKLPEAKSAATLAMTAAEHVAESLTPHASAQHLPATAASSSAALLRQRARAVAPQAPAVLHYLEAASSPHAVEPVALLAPMAPAPFAPQASASRWHWAAPNWPATPTHPPEFELETLDLGPV